jgi:lactate permease
VAILQHGYTLGTIYRLETETTTNFMYTLLAATPLLVILILMLGFRWGGAKAGGAGLFTALLVAGVGFGAGLDVLFWAQVHGFFRAAYVLYIIWGALFFFRVTEAGGTLEAMSTMLRQLAPSRILQVLLLAWAFASFLQSVGGFGVPVAVVAPILVTMGFPALDAVVMPSIGLTWAVAFGSLGAPYEALISATGIERAVVAPWVAASMVLVCLLSGVSVLGKASGKRLPVRELAPLLSMAAAMSLVQYATVQIGIEHIAALLGAVAGLVVGGIWAVLRRRERVEEVIQIAPKQALVQILPYLLLVAVILAVSFIPFLDRHLNRLVLSVQVPDLYLEDGTMIPGERTRSISLFGHPGAQLILISTLTLLWIRRRNMLPPGSGASIRRGVLRSGSKSTLGILTMMAMATTMQMSGMVSQLSASMAALAGGSFPLISAFIGALGAFMTGSNTNSNVMFGAFQLEVAQTLGLHVPLILALHNAGAGIGSVFGPAKIIVGCSTVGLSGGESEALQSTASHGLIFIAVLAVIGWLLTGWLPGT